MKIGSKLFHAIAAAALVLALSSAWLPASAQDADPGASVDVSCWANPDSGGTDCAFTPGPAGAVSYLTVPAGVLCATVLSTGAADWSGDGISQSITTENPSIVVSFDGVVSVSGGASYGADLEGVGGTTIGGSGVVCGDGDGTTGSQEVDDPTEVPTDVVDQPTDVPNEGTPTSEDTGDNPDPVVTDEPTVEPEATTITVTVGAFDCATDPGAADPSTFAGCLPAAGVEISGTADSTPLGPSVTDESGYVSFTIDAGTANVTFTENPATIRAGYAELGSGSVSATPSDGLVLTFAHLGGGRLQIINGSCPTSGESRTEFRVIEPRSVSEAATSSCTLTENAAFTISGAALAGDIVVTTGSDGAWRGYLPAGDYTVTENATGESTGVTVVADDISVIIAVDYVAAPLGVVNVSRFTCENQETGGLLIQFSGHASAYGDDADCSPSNQDITIDVQSEVTTESIASFRLGSDGVAEVELPSGSYRITDVATGKFADFNLDAGRRVYATILDRVVRTGSIGGGDDDDGGNDGTGNNNGGGNSGGGSNGGGDTGGGNAGGSSDGTGVSGGGGTDGGVDAGVSGGSETDDLAAVTALPNTGGRSDDGSSIAWLLLVIALGAAGGGAYARKRRAA